MFDSVRRLALVPAIGVACLASRSEAQFCFTFDNLDGPCWEYVVPDLPYFPECELESSNICWDECYLKGDNKTNVFMSAPVQAPCGQYRSDLTVTSAFGPILAGTLVLDYTRTWEEFTPEFGDFQAWRFAAKVDLRNIATDDVPIGCPPGLIPDCIGDNATAFYYGYVDYAIECATGDWNCVLVLFHNCDVFIHDPATSSVPGTFHPTSTFAIVAPDTAANPFVPAINPAPGGGLVSEAVRNVSNGVPFPFCIAEEDIVEGVMDPQFNLCMCPLTETPAQVTLRIFNGIGNCPDPNGNPSSFTSLDVTPLSTPWFHLVTSSIGNWTTGNSYPGPEIAWVDEGVFAYHDSCAINADGEQGEDYIEFFYGGTTCAGWSASSLDPDTPVTQNFTDLADNYSAVTSGPINGPFVGTVLQSDHLIYVNY